MSFSRQGLNRRHGVVESVRDVAIEKQHESSSEAAAHSDRRTGGGNGLGEAGLGAGTGLGTGPGIGDQVPAGHVELNEAAGEVGRGLRDLGGEDGGHAGADYGGGERAVRSLAGGAA